MTNQEECRACAATGGMNYGCDGCKNAGRLPSEITYDFMHLRKVRKIINSLFPNSYDQQIPDLKNRLLFLQRVKRESKYRELDKLLPTNQQPSTTMNELDFYKLARKAVNQWEWKNNSLTVFVVYDQLQDFCCFLGRDYWAEDYGAEHAHVCYGGSAAFDSFEVWMLSHGIDPSRIFDESGEWE